jgi:hypothetical protein
MFKIVIYIKDETLLGAILVGGGFYVFAVFVTRAVNVKRFVGLVRFK